MLDFKVRIGRTRMRNKILLSSISGRASSGARPALHWAKAFSFFIASLVAAGSCARAAQCEAVSRYGSDSPTINVRYEAVAQSIHAAIHASLIGNPWGSESAIPIRGIYLSYKLDDRQPLYLTLHGSNDLSIATPPLRPGTHLLTVELRNGSFLLQSRAFCWSF